MGKKKQKISSDVVIVNVLYEDGAQRSNRKVPAAELSGYDDENEIWRFIQAQDLKIAEMSGEFRAPIKSITRVGKR